jgi:hypothetical protein
MHADIEFSPLERHLISRAVEDLHYQTAGLLRVELEYDLDYGVSSVLREEPMLVRQPLWAPLTFRVDEDIKGTALGFTKVGAAHCFLVADRLDSPEIWRHVTMHELLHAAGLHDLPTTPHDIMARSRTRDVPLCMSRADAVEFCRANRCDAERLNYCRPPT